MTISEIGIEPTYIDYVERDGYSVHLYDVELTYKGRNFTTSYMMGSAHTEDPKLKDVLYSLFADASTIESCDGSFEDWCHMLGYNSDSISDKKTYDDIIANTEALEFLLGPEYSKIRRAIEKEYE